MAAVAVDLYMTVHRYVKTVDTDGHCDGGFIMTVYRYVKIVDTDGRCGGGFIYDRIPPVYTMSPAATAATFQATVDETW